MNFEQNTAEQVEAQKEKKKTIPAEIPESIQEKNEIIGPTDTISLMRKDYKIEKEKNPGTFEKILGRNKIMSFIAGTLLLANVSAVEANDSGTDKKEFLHSQPDSIESIVSDEKFSYEEEQRRLTNFPRYVGAFLGKVFAQKAIATESGAVKVGDKKMKEIVDDIYFQEQLKEDSESLKYNKYLKNGGHTKLSPEIRLFSKDSQGNVGLGFQINVPYGVDGLGDSLRNLGGAIKEKGKIFDGTYRVGHSAKLILQDLVSAFGDSVLSKQKAKDMAENGNDPLERR